MTARVLMVQGTMSSVGKSLLVTGLCRLYARRGLRVAPFKAQNMSNNAAVCLDGGEIGRAQFTQALACGIQPTVDMNPILLKPEADNRSQVIVMGRPRVTSEARDYYRMRAELWQIVTAALDGLRAAFDLVIIEGAGSPVELNLKPNDMVNMKIARYASAPVLLVGDIDRGGIFAQLLGTLALLEPEERALVRWLAVNKFRGDATLFEDGIRILEARAGIPVAGVVPWFYHHLPEEDAVALEDRRPMPAAHGALDIAVVQLPRIANFDDFDPLRREPGLTVRYVSSLAGLGRPDAIILPGTKSTIADLEWLRAQGLAAALRDFASQGGSVAGICGGYQMLGRLIRDPGHVESPRDQAEGLGLLPVETDFADGKSTYQVSARITASGPGWLAGLAGGSLTGYEIHTGRPAAAPETSWLEITSRNVQPVSVFDGASSADGRVWGCYLHGLFANQDLRRAWLGSLGWQPPASSREETLTHDFDLLADHLERSLDISLLDRA